MDKGLNMDIDELKSRFAAEGQGHIFSDWDKLTEEERRTLAEDASHVDFAWLSDRKKELASPSAASSIDMAEMRPASVAELPKTPQEIASRKRARKSGESALADGRLAAFLVAGGQGTRLGYDGPKGCYPIGPITGKPLFAWHAEKIIAASKRYGKTIPWYVMTSKANNAATQAFFKEHAYFGFNPRDLIFFTQGEVPSITPEGLLLRSSRGHLAMNPDGHGGSLSALVMSGALEDMKKRGIQTISYFQVDNPLVNICDPEFLGLHLRGRAEISSKILQKRDPKEKVGHIVQLSDGRLACVEYSDLPNELAEQRDGDGRLRFWAGSIAIHMIETEFVERIGGKSGLPWHVARKKIPFYDGEKIVKPENANGVKFETFVFDSLPLAERAVTVETQREEEFAPVKNAEGEDSPASCRAMLCARFTRWLMEIGASVPLDAQKNPAAQIEISPLYALDAGELKRKFNKNTVIEHFIALG
jgi:UDP-N-acetylglucosamine/UDP-N-acetylgalactosamine diphosphorylase